MKSSTQYLHSVTVAGLIAVLVLTQTAFTQTALAQDSSPQSTSQQQSPAPIERQAQTAPPTTPPNAEALARQRLLSAHTLYLAQGTQDAGFPVPPDDAYNLVLNDLRNWGHYQIVDSIGQADLVLQLHDVVKTSVVDAADPNDPSAADVYYLPSFQITVADPSTLAPLWSVNSSIPTTIKRNSQTALLSASAQNVVSQLKLLVGDSLTTQDVAAQKQVTHYYHTHLALYVGLTAGATAAALALFFVFKHNAQNNQAAFCAAHGISPCPGA